MRLALLLGALLAAGVAACGGGGSGASSPPLPATKSAATAQGTLILAFASPSPAQAKRRPAFVSPNAKSAVVHIPGTTDVVADVSSGSPSCAAASGGGRTCTISVGAPLGSSVTITVTLYDAAGGTGNVLGSGTTTTSVTSSGFSVTILMNGVVAALAVSLSAATLTRGQSGTSTVTVNAYDSSGAQITGSAPYTSTITVSTNDTTGTVSASGTTISTPQQTALLSYNGSYTAPRTIAITASDGTATMTTPLTIGQSTLTASRYTDPEDPPYVTSSPNPWQIVAAPDGALYFNEAAGRRIQRISSAGTLTVPNPASANTTGNPAGIAVGSDGNLWFDASWTTGAGAACQVGKLVPGASIATFYNLPGATSFCNGPMALGPDGNVWLFEVSMNAMVRITPAGAATSYPTNAGGCGSALCGVVAGSDGNLWYTEYLAGMVSSISPTGHVADYPLHFTGAKPLGMTKGPDNALWFVDIGTNAVGRVDPTNPAGTLMEWTFPNPASFANPTQIVSGPDGNLWVAQGAGTLRITPTVPPAFTQLNFADGIGVDTTGMTVGPDNRIWVTARGNLGNGQPDQVYAFMPQ